MAPGLGRRMACWLYEGILLFAVAFIAGYLFSTLTQTRHALQNRNGLQLFLGIVFGIYFVWFWSKGQTLAMKTWRIRVVDRNLEPLTQQRALFRFVLSWAWFIPPLLVSALAQWTPSASTLAVVGWIVFWATASRLHPQRQFWHDAWAGTKLISSGSILSDNNFLCPN